MRTKTILLLVPMFAVSNFSGIRSAVSTKARDKKQADPGAPITVAANTRDDKVDTKVPPLVEPVKAAPVSFLNDVLPLINKLGCNQTKCHGAAMGQSGFKLSMFGAEPDYDYAALTKSADGRRINRVEPVKSLFLLKATKSIPHKGGQKFSVDSTEYRMLASWVAKGAPWGDENGPKLLSIKIAPREQILQPEGAQQLSVHALFSDGSQKDVTHDAQFTFGNNGVASVDANGRVKANHFGETIVVVNYVRHFGTVRIIVPQTLPTAFPKVPASNKIDEFVFAKLKKLGIPWSELCSDSEFLRRIYLDVTGTLPTVDQTRAFLTDRDPQKRSRLVDQLLASEEFAAYWTLKWGDLFRMKSEYPSNLWPNAVQAYQKWIHDSIVKNKPFDQFARELITSSGSNFRVPPTNFYRAFLKRTPQDLGEVTALIFMGARIGCARCHAHPQESWTLDDEVGLAAFFAQVRYKRTQEWKEEIVYVNPKQTMRHPRTNEIVQPKLPGADALPIETQNDLRVKFADWLTAPDNPWFARNIVNRTWFWLLGRGIIHEPDDLRSTNPPENPELLAYLTKQLVSHKYDLKHIYRLILNSRTYQLSSKANKWNQNDIAHFSHYQVKRLGAEALLDAIGQVTQRWDTYRSSIPEPYVAMPNGYRATHLADGSIGLPFLELFGRPPRNTAYESDRDSELSMRQTLHLLNSSDVQNKINASPWLRQLIQENKTDAPVVESLYLAVLSRPPTDAEATKVLAYVSAKSNAPLQQPLAEKIAAEAALAKVRSELAKTKAQYDAAEKAARLAETAFATAKATVPKRDAARVAAQKTATAKRRQANQAKKTVDDLIQERQKPAEAKLAAATKVVADVTATKVAADAALTQAKAGVTLVQQKHAAAEKAAQEAEAKVVSKDSAKSEEGKKKAQAEATAKRQAADAAMAALTQAQEKQQEAERRVTSATQELAAATKEQETATKAVADAKAQIPVVRKIYETTEKAAQAAEQAAAKNKTDAEAARTALATAQKDAAAKRKLANDTKTKRDKLTSEERTANSKLAAANRKVSAASSVQRTLRQQTLQDVLWALLNTKEFIFNH